YAYSMDSISDNLNDPETGLTIRESPEGTEGPEDFAMVSSGNIYILDSPANRIQHYVSGQYKNTIPLPDGERYLRLKLWGKKLYVLGQNRLLKIDLNSEEFSTISLPEIANFGAYVVDIVVRSNRLVFVTETLGNYEYIPPANPIQKSEVTYSVSRNGGISGDTVVIADSGSLWGVPAKDLWITPVGFSSFPSLFVSAIRQDLPRDAEGYCSVLEYAKDGTLLNTIPINTSSLKYLPHHFATLGSDGNLYMLLIYEDHFTIRTTEFFRTEPSILE
ncbi:MAG: hypothetical protein ILO68_02910, partial [Clostridia bacterium]|nr:hypothetical protein [Clostridia bacterium]